MTIGIAASGPGAGRAILEALAKAEAVGTGAIGGFLSFACLSEGRLLRAGRQRDGARGFLAAGVPEEMASAPLAVLMSSGPDRPEPLAQFTPADAAAGLVTGHRFLNAPSGRDPTIGERALQALRQGLSPMEAAESVTTADPDADAGIICLGLDGEIGIANTAYVATFPGLGRAERRRGTARVGVLCNAIHPGGVIAELVADLVAEALSTPRVAGAIRLGTGLRVLKGPVAELRVDEHLRPRELVVPSFPDRTGPWCGGYGPAARLVRDGKQIGTLIEEPFLTGSDSRIDAFDGSPSISVNFTDGTSG